jgi:hypothetical protein
VAAAGGLAGRDCARQIRAATRQGGFGVSDGGRPYRGQRAIQQSARDAAGFALRQEDTAGSARPDLPVAVFDGAIVAIAALAAPEVMVRPAGAILARFGDLSDDEREIVFETYRVWQEIDASGRLR